MTCAPWPIVWPCDPAELLVESPLRVADPENPGTFVPLDAAEVAQMVQDAAQGLLWAHTGRRVGICTVREAYRVPGTDQCAPPNRSRFAGTAWASCCRIQLASQPVYRVTDVSINGVDLLPDDWHVEGSWLMRHGGCWPAGGDCDVAPIEVVYEWGVPIRGRASSTVALAMGETACELLHGLLGADCRLPSNAVSISRNGVTVELGDAETLWTSGRTGLAMADQMIRLFNPGRLQDRPRMVSPDMPRQVR